MAEHSAVVGIYPTHTEAEAAVKALQQSGFDMQKLSIVGKDYHTEEHVIGYYTTSDRMQVWGNGGPFGAGSGACWSGRASFYSRYRPPYGVRSPRELDHWCPGRSSSGGGAERPWRRAV